MITLISHRNLSGDYGAIPAGHVFDVDEQTAQSLEARGLASRYRRPPTAKDILSKMESPYENKMMGTAVPEVKDFVPVIPEVESLPAPFSFRRPGRPRKNP